MYNILILHYNSIHVICIKCINMINDHIHYILYTIYKFQNYTHLCVDNDVKNVIRMLNENNHDIIFDNIVGWLVGKLLILILKVNVRTIYLQGQIE